MFDINDPADLAALKTEITTDPNTYGYDPTSTYTGILDIINEKRGTITVSKPFISPIDIKKETTYDAYNNLAIDEQEWLRWMTADVSGQENLAVTSDLRDRLTGVTGGSATGDSIWAVADRATFEPAMLSLIDVDGSRAEELFGYGTTISRNDWIAARDS